MKRKILLTFFGLCVFTSMMNAQLSTYSFSAVSGTFTPVSGGTTVAAVQADDAVSGAIPIGFNFVFNGITYTNVYASSNGFLSFNAATGSATANNLPASGAATRPLLAPLWDDLEGTGHSASYITTGSAGSRVFTFEWLDWEWRYPATVPVISFQVKLYETTNAIEFIYRQEAGAVNATGIGSIGASIGIAAVGTGTGNFISLNNSSTSPTPSLTTETSNITTKPATGQIYRFVVAPSTPPAPTQAAGVPTCLGGSQITVTGTPPANVNWYWQGTNPNGTSMTQDYTTPYTAFANGTYYLRAYDSVTALWSTASSSVVISNFPVSTTPPVPTAGANPACYSTTLTVAAPPVGVSYWWQGTTVNGISTANSASVGYPVNATGTYHLSAYDSVSGCWSNSSSLPVTVVTTITPVPTAPVNSVVCSGSGSAIISATPGPNPPVNTILSSGTVNLAIPDNSTTGVSSILATALPAGAVITNVTVNLNITHTWDSDVSIFLTAPNGTQIDLSSGNGGSGDNYTNTTFSSSAATNITAGAAPFTGTFLPEGSLPSLYSVANGNWTLFARDGAAGDVGTLVNWSLTITYTTPTTITWWDAPTAGTLQGSTNPIETVGTPLLPNANTPGTYSFYAQGESGTCPSQTRLLVNVVVNPVLVAINPINVTCNGANNGSFSVGTITCGTPGFTFSVDGGPFGAIPTNLTPGNHSVVVRDTNNLDAQPVNITITEPSWTVPNPTTATSVSVCTGASSAELSAVMPSGGFTTSSSFGTNLQSPGPATPFTITLPALPPGAVVTSTTLNLTTVNAINGSWRSEIRVALSGASTLAATQISVLGSGGLITPDPVINIPNVPASGGSITLTLSESFDDGGAGTIDATFGNAEIVVHYTLPLTVDWYDAPANGNLQGSGNPFETVGTAVLPNTNVAGNYNFYAGFNLAGCPSSTRAQGTVSVSDVVVTLNPIHITCNGANNGSFSLGTVSCGTPGFTYSVDAGPFGPVPTNLTPGLHNIIVQDTLGGQSDNIAITITQPSWVAIAPTTMGDTICVGDAAAFVTASVAIADTVTLTIPFDVVSTPAETDIAPGTLFSTANLASIPAGSTIISAVLTYPGVNSVGGSWQSEVRLELTGSIASPGTVGTGAANSGGVFTYTRNIAPNQINFAGGPLNLHYWESFNDGAPNPDATFPTGTAVANIVIKYLPAATISWWSAPTGGTNLITDDTLQTVGTSVLPNSNTAGAYNFYAETSYNGCTSLTRSIAVVNVGAYPVVNLGADAAYCNNHVLNAGNTGSTYLWNDATTAQTLNALDTGLYYVDVTSALGCTTRDSINLVINPLPTVNLGPDTTSCGSYTLNPGPQPLTSSFLWNNSATTPTLTITNSGDWHVTVTDVNGCMNSDTVTVNVPPVTYTNIGPDTVLCTNNPGFILDAYMSGLTYEWQDGTNDSVYYVDLPGTYWVDVTNFVNCTSRDSIVIVSVYPTPTNIDVNFVTTTSATLDAGSGFGSYLWSTSASTQTITVNTNGTYYVTVSDNNGCITTDTVNIVFSLGIFNPNGSSTTMKLYPNPSDGVFNVSIDNLETSNLTLEVMDIHGKVVYNRVVGAVSGSVIEPFNLSDLSMGTYILRLTANGQSSNLRFIVGK